MSSRGMPRSMREPRNGGDEQSVVGRDRRAPGRAVGVGRALAGAGAGRGPSGPGTGALPALEDPAEVGIVLAVALERP